jgi:hypothetical protein
MPNRIIRESICVSPSIDCLCPQAETLFFRLLTAADDFGRFDARASVIRGRCFPLKKYTDAMVEKWIREIEKVEMVMLYEVRGVRYGQFNTWELHNSIRTKRSKYPEPETKAMQAAANICEQMIPSRARAESESESESDSESNPNPILLPKAGKIQLSAEGAWSPEISDWLPKWKGAYPAVDVEAEIRKAAIWIQSNPTNKKSNYARFLSNWMNRTQDRARPTAKTFDLKAWAAEEDRKAGRL